MHVPSPTALQDLLAGAASSDPFVPMKILATHGDLGVAIDGLTHDSRQARPGCLFVAYRGVNLDVHRFIPDASARGASAFLVERSPAELIASGLLPADAAAVQVASARAARGLIAAALYGFPSRRLAVIGITGTDGKTTTSTLTHAMLQAAGIQTGLVTTVAAQIGDQAIDTGLHVTTPEAEELQAFLATMADAGMAAAVLEVTSHGLDQHRVTGVAFDIAAFTNVTHEALEYHGTFEAYRAAKGLLFARLSGPETKPAVPKAAVLNADDPAAEYFAGLAPASAEIWRYSIDPVAEADGRRSTASEGGGGMSRPNFYATDIEHTPLGLRFIAHTPVESLTIRSPLVGRYNVSNLLAAMAASYRLGAGPAAWQLAAAAVGGVPGRMERLALGQDFTAIVDFAHTPNALAAALITARELAGAAGRVVVVFGCAGLRDPSKREAMGRVAGERADAVLVTAEDPRTESLEAIMAAIAGGLQSVGRLEGRDYWRVADRGEAIVQAVKLAGPGDVVIVCGKGHEQSLCFGTTEWPWDDRIALAAAIRREAQKPLPTSARAG